MDCLGSIFIHGVPFSELDRRNCLLVDRKNGTGEGVFFFFAFDPEKYYSLMLKRVVLDPCE